MYFYTSYQCKIELYCHPLFLSFPCILLNFSKPSIYQFQSIHHLFEAHISVVEEFDDGLLMLGLLVWYEVDVMLLVKDLLIFKNVQE